MKLRPRLKLLLSGSLLKHFGCAVIQWLLIPHPCPLHKCRALVLRFSFAIVCQVLPSNSVQIKQCQTKTNFFSKLSVNDQIKFYFARRKQKLNKRQFHHLQLWKLITWISCNTLFDAEKWRYPPSISMLPVDLLGVRPPPNSSKA